MKNQIITTERTELNFADECASFLVRIGGTACALIGIWAAACLVSALISAGPVEVIKGYITAISGM